MLSLLTERQFRICYGKLAKVPGVAHALKLKKKKSRLALKAADSNIHLAQMPY